MQNSKGLTIIAILIILGGFIWVMNTDENKSLEKVAESVKQKEYNGIVAEKFIDSKNHNEPIIILSNKKRVIEWGIYASIKIGDSLSKKRNSNVLEVFRNSKKVQIDLVKIVNNRNKN